MANEFHLILTPRVAEKPDATITLGFDDPVEADKVVIRLFEVDAWGSGPGRVVENKGRDTLIAELTGKIVEKKFVLDKKKPQGKMGDKPEMNLLIDGEDVVRALPFPKSAIVNEDGVFEVEARVSGVILGNKKTGKTEIPLFLRNFKAGRPVVAFITGNLKDPFFEFADVYWKGVADGKFARASVESIRNFLVTQADARGYGPWGQVNIVSHGNEFEWIVQLFKSDKGVRHVHTKDLKAVSSDPRLSGPIPSLDKDSRVVIRGCSLGNDQALLDEIRKVFGGEAVVLAPKFPLVYGIIDGKSREGFMKAFFFYVPGSKAPGDYECKRQLGAKFPSVKDADWLPMLRNKGKLTFKQQLEGYRHDLTEKFPMRMTFSFPHSPGRTPPSSVAPKDFIQLVRNDWKNDEEHFNTAFDEWKWSQGPLMRKEEKSTPETSFVRVVTGVRHRIEVRRELRDANGDPVRPDINNKEYFGRSPAWP